MRYLTTALMLLALCPVPSAGQPPGKPRGSERIDALTSASSLVTFSEDGAADTTVTENPAPEVKAIVGLGARAIPLLISHLDDTRLTAATCNGGFTRGKSVRVPVGYVCLDILTNIIGDNPHILIKDCADDGLGACVKGAYYFRPDEYYPAGRDYMAREGVRATKVNWLRVYRQGRIKFQYPSWWKRRI